MNRRAWIWRGAAALSIVGCFVAAAQWQRNHHAKIRAELAAVETQYANAALKNSRFEEISNKLRAERKSAEMLTFLRHRWPRTQVIAAIVGPMPDSVVLCEWHMGQETIASAAPPAIALPEANVVPTDKPDKRADDLKHLLHDASTRRHFVFLAGNADEAAALHAYLAQLGTNALFAHVDLLSLEHVPVDKSTAGRTGAIRFTARAILQPGHGQSIVHPPAAPANATAASPWAGQGGLP